MCALARGTFAGAGSRSWDGGKPQHLCEASRSAAFFAASDGYASLLFYTAIIALCSERHAVTFNGLARRVFFSLL